MKLIDVTDQSTWDQFVNASPFGHPLQLSGWGEAKVGNGWTAHRLMSEDGAVGAQVLTWPIPKTGHVIAYVPRGPVCDPAASADLLASLAIWAKAHKALYLRVEPAWNTAKFAKPWVKSKNVIQLEGTYTLNLAKSEAELLEAMERKHRQYINKSEREGVVVRRLGNESLDEVWRIYSETAKRAGFGIHDRAYYDQLRTDLGAYNWIYVAEVEGKAEAFLWLATGGVTAYELYGGITAAGQAARANYILKWTAIRDMKEVGGLVYDFNGRLNDGVGKFKDGFGPDHTDWVGTWDYPINKLGYAAWDKFWPVIKPLGRRVLKLIKR